MRLHDSTLIHFSADVPEDKVFARSSGQVLARSELHAVIRSRCACHCEYADSGQLEKKEARVNF
jgi:hypothetical protein